MSCKRYLVSVSVVLFVLVASLVAPLFTADGADAGNAALSCQYGQKWDNSRKAWVCKNWFDYQAGRVWESAKATGKQLDAKSREFTDGVNKVKDGGKFVVNSCKQGQICK